MTYMDVISGMQSIGLPCVYGEYNKKTPLPYTIILFEDSDDVMADNHNYFGVGNYMLELYTAKKERATEKLVEDWLKAQRIPFRKSSPGFLKSEEMYLTVYDIQLLGG